MIEVLAKGMVVIILQYLNVLNQHVAHFKLTRWYMIIISQSKRERERDSTW